MPKIFDTPPRIVFLHTGFPGNWFSLVCVFFFKILLSLRRRPHFRASARSESCSRCSAGLISALPLVPNRAPAAALASFLRFRSFRIVLPLQRWPHFRTSAHSESCYRCSADVISSPMPRHAMQYYIAFRCTMPCYVRCHVMLCHVMLCFALQYFAVQFSTPQHHAML